MQPRRHEGTKKNKLRVFFVSSCLRVALFVVVAAIPAAAQSAADKPVTYKGLEISVAGVERAANAA
jgi:hypothetical protein